MKYMRSAPRRLRSPHGDVRLVFEIDSRPVAVFSELVRVERQDMETDTDYPAATQE